MKLYIIRHGVTAWNSERRIQGASDIPLAEEGILLAKKTGEALKDVIFDICFTSPLIRARHTAELILGEKGKDVPMVEDERIREISFGVLEGTKCQDENGTYISEEFEKFFMSPETFKRPEKGENIADICARTRDFWMEKINDPALQDKTVMIATHGCATRALLQNVYKENTGFWHGCVPPNCAVNIVEVTEGNVKLISEDLVYTGEVCSTYNTK